MAFLSRHISYYERRRGDLLDAVPHLWVLDGFDQGCQEGADWTNGYCDGISEKAPSNYGYFNNKYVAKMFK